MMRLAYSGSRYNTECCNENVKSNATIVQRYYSSASQMPNGERTDIRVSAYHLEKIENEQLRKQYEDTLNDVYCAITKRDSSNTDVGRTS